MHCKNRFCYTFIVFFLLVSSASILTLSAIAETAEVSFNESSAHPAHADKSETLQEPVIKATTAVEIGTPPVPADLAFPTLEDLVKLPSRPTDEEIHQENLRRFRRGEKLNMLEASRQAMWAGDNKSALMFAGESLKQGLDTCEARLVRGQSLLWGGQAQAAADEYWQFFRAGGLRTPDTLYQYASALKAKKQYSEASGLLFEALDKPQTEIPADSTKEQRQRLQDKYKKLRADIMGSIASCYQNRDKLIKAGQWIRYARDAGWPEAKYQEAMGGLTRRLADEKKSLVFLGTRWQEKPHEGMLRKALDHYRRSRRLDAENDWLLPSIGEILWILGDRQGGIDYFRRATDTLVDSSWPPMQLASYIVDVNPNDPETLKQALKLMEKARRRGAEKPAVALRKAQIYEVLGQTAEVLLNLRDGVRFCKGDVYYASELASRAIRYNLLDEVFPLLDRMVQGKVERFAGVWNRIEWLKVRKTPVDVLISFIEGQLREGGFDDSQRFDLYTRLRDLDPDGFAVRLGPEILSEYERLRDVVTASRFAANDRKLAVLEMGLPGKSGDERTLWLSEKASVYSSMGKNQEAGHIMVDLALDVEPTDPRRIIRLRDAYRYYNWGGIREDAARTGKTLFELGDTSESILSSLIRTNWYGRDPEFARKVLSRLKEVHPESPVTLQYDGRKDMETWRYLSARKKIQMARTGVKESEQKDLDDLLKSVAKGRERETVTEFFNLGDTSRTHDFVIREKLMLPQEGWKLFVIADKGRVSKPNMLRDQRTLLSRFMESGIGAQWPVKNGEMELFLTRLDVNPQINGSYSKTLGSFMWRRRFGPLSLRFRAGRELMMDTPLAQEMGLLERTMILDFYMEKKRWIYSGAVTQRRVSDNNTRHQGNLNLGYQIPRWGAILRGTWNFNTMDREFDPAFANLGNLPANLVRPWEVYYAPNHIKAKGLGLEFNRRLGPVDLNLYLGFSRSNRPVVNTADVRILAFNLVYPTKWGDLEYSFYGSKSEVDPLSDQTRKSKYVGREGTWRFRRRF